MSCNGNDLLDMILPKIYPDCKRFPLVPMPATRDMPGE
jgi:hypothetical protein